MATNHWSRYHYNALAKEIRELFPTAWAESDHTRRATLTALAISLAARFKEDNPNFDPLKFLNACSPNTDLYPLGELWENHER